MVTALLRAVAALSLPPLRRVVTVGLGLSLLTFAILWAVVGAILYNTPFLLGDRSIGLLTCSVGSPFWR